jgi:hypothetical protein
LQEHPHEAAVIGAFNLNISLYIAATPTVLATAGFGEETVLGIIFAKHGCSVFGCCLTNSY